jgi:hypothetical protein
MQGQRDPGGSMFSYAPIDERFPSSHCMLRIRQGRLKARQSSAGIAMLIFEGAVAGRGVPAFLKATVMSKL